MKNLISLSKPINAKATPKKSKFASKKRPKLKTTVTKATRSKAKPKSSRVLVAKKKAPAKKSDIKNVVAPPAPKAKVVGGPKKPKMTTFGANPNFGGTKTEPESSETVGPKKDANGKTWWDRKSLKSKKEYLERFPGSKMAGKVREILKNKRMLGTLTVEDKELLKSQTEESHLPEERPDTELPEPVEDERPANPTVKEKGILKNLIKFGKHQIIKRIRNKDSIAHTLLKAKNGHELNDKDWANTKKALLVVGGAMFVTMAAAGLFFMAPAALPDFINSYMGDTFGGGTGPAAGLKVAASDEKEKSSDQILSEYLDHMTEYMLKTDLTKLHK
jgi:hypothetical protein